VRNGKIHVELLGKFGSSEELDRSIELKSRSIEFCPKSIDQNFPELTFVEARQNTQSRVSP
jgi:hypothetical protein